MNFYTFNYKGFEFKVRVWSKRQLELNCYKEGQLVWSANEFISSLKACSELVGRFLKMDDISIRWSVKVSTERIQANKKVLH